MVAILQPLKNHKPIPIDRAVVLVGRGSECDAVINGSRKISRKHCCLVQSDQSFFIRDLGSTNGVWVNGTRVDCISEISDGDRVAIGDVHFQFWTNGYKKTSGNQGLTQDALSAGTPPSNPAGSGIDIRRSQPSPQSSKRKLSRREARPESIINLDDSFADEEIDDIIDFSD